MMPASDEHPDDGTSDSDFTVFTYSSDGADGAPSDAHELSHLRIQRISAEGRSGARMRSYCVIAAAVCVVLAIDLTGRIARAVHAADNQQPGSTAGQTVLLFGALYGAWHFVRRAIALTREIKVPVDDEPPASPEFSSLSDGSQHADALGAMTDSVDPCNAVDDDSPSSIREITTPNSNPG